MSVVMVPPRPRGWTGATTYTGPDSRVDSRPVWVPCVTCGGQGRVYLWPRRWGQDPVAYVICPHCLGTTQRGGAG